MRIQTPFAFIAAALAGCASVPPGNKVCPSEAPAASRAIFTGEWHTNFGTLKLSQNGADVHGDYEDVVVNDRGTLDGTVNGNTLKYHFVEAQWTGDGVFTMCADRASVAGYSWISGTSAEYAWSGTRVSGPPSDAAAPSAPASSPALIQSDEDEPSYASGAQRPNDFALLIGISKYRDIPEAEFAEKDADAMKRHLLAMGYPEENIIALIGDHATNTSIAEKLERWLPMNVGANSTVFVYYSGHGAPDPVTKQAYLVPWDGEPGDLADTAFPLSRFYKDLQNLPAKRVLVALDSCFSGAGGR